MTDRESIHDQLVREMIEEIARSIDWQAVVEKNKAFLEPINPKDVHSGITCEWWPYECRKVADWTMVSWDGYEWIAPAYCRPHANLALIYERQAFESTTRR